MNQVEIAKKILEQGDCKSYSAICSNGCPFNKGYGMPCTVDEGRDKNKVKQWLKERENMIDLNINQIVDPPVKCWVKDDNEDKWKPRWLVAIVNKRYYSIENIEHYHEVTLLDAFKYGGCAWQQCSLTDPTIPIKKIKKWERVEDIPVELWGRALTKKKHHAICYANVLEPSIIAVADGRVDHEYHYLPLGQPLTGEWLPFESEE